MDLTLRKQLYDKRGHFTYGVSNQPSHAWMAYSLLVLANSGMLNIP